MYRSRSNSSLRLKSDLYQIVSWRVMPVRWANMSRMDTVASRASLEKWMPGTNSRTGRSQSSFPSSTRSPAAVAVNSFVLEAMGTTVFVVKGSFLP